MSVGPDVVPSTIVVFVLATASVTFAQLGLTVVPDPVRTVDDV